MTGETEPPATPKVQAVPTRAERQKAALKANMARRKAQARARAAEDEAGEDRRDTNE